MVKLVKNEMCVFLNVVTKNHVCVNSNDTKEPPKRDIVIYITGKDADH